MDIDREANEAESQSPAGDMEGNVDETPDSQHTNGDADGVSNGGGGEEGEGEQGEGEGEQGEGEGEGEGEAAMELEEGEGNSYIGDNCISTPAHTESNSPSEGGDSEPGAVGTEASQSEAVQGSPDQSVSSNTTTDQDVKEGVWESEPPLVQNQGISSSTMPPQEDLLCSTTNTAADTSMSSEEPPPVNEEPPQTQQAPQIQYNMPVSSSDMPLIQQQVSSSCGGTEDSSVSSNTAPNGLMGSDALATLASAALNRQNSQSLEKEEDPWYTVGIVKGTTFTVHDYIIDPKLDLSGLSIDSIPDLSGYQTTPLEPGTGYKFRVAAINSCGLGDFGEESPFKTCVPGYPGAPSDIKISKSVEGAHLSWEPPQASPEGIQEYSVYLAVKPLNPSKSVMESKSQLTFVRVYCGKETWCVVGQPSLTNAHVDSSTKPAIIFRIAARNDKGYGPATQVRWLQENKSNTVKRIMDGRPQGPPPKQAKPLH